VIGSLDPAPILLYVGSIFWVIGYDTIYAHQDKEDDALAGVKSTARLFGDRTRMAISALYAAAILLFGAAISQAIPIERPGMAMIVAPAYIGLGAGGLHMLWQMKHLDIDNPEQCLRLFRSNNQFGWLLFAGFAVSVLFSAVL
jgi:4-hydroxybenzoate polyprenyltransferase